MKSLVYLQGGFWKKLSEDSSREGIRTMLDVSDALEGSEVISDLSEEMILHDKFLMAIIKQKKYQRCDENYICKQIDSLNTVYDAQNLSATYLLDKNNHECKEIEDKYGVIVLNASNIDNRRYLFKGDGFSLDKKRCYKLRYLTFKNKLSHPCNSLIIIDPYLLIDKKTNKDNGFICFPGIENNLESLLDAILPLQLSVDFHLTIISSLKRPDDVKRAYEKVRKCLKRIRKELTIRFSFVYTSIGYRFDVESFHSRHVLSNTFALDSEDGLDLFNTNGCLTKNNPSVSIVFPRLFGNYRQDITKYYNWILSVKKYIDEMPDTLICGDKENRLLKLVSEI